MTQPAAAPTLLDAGFVQGSASSVQARKRPIRVAVRFCGEPTMVTTREGQVTARAGDAILTDADGRSWPVSRVRFATKYRPTPNLAPGADGIYEALPILVDAVQVPFAFVVRTREGGDLLQGIPGDWLVDYGDGSLGIVGEAIFRDSYQVLEQ